MTSACRVGIVAAAAVLLLVEGAVAEVVSVGVYSRRESPSRARIGGSVTVGYETTGASGSREWSTPSSTYSGSSSGSSESAGYSWPTLSNDDPLLDDPTPEGDGTFWMNVGTQRCIYNAASNGICFNVAAPGAGGPGAARIDPRALAELAARRLPLLPGEIAASPSRELTGLTGAPSWFWLDPAPEVQALTVAQGGERVTVTAVPSKVVWAFGDGREVDAGPGRPYGEQTTEREDAVRHRYRTRCLPGDQGRNPYVLDTCTAEGYEVEASVEWTISFEAVGPIVAADALPPQTTSTTIAYPVSEVRGFLAREGAR